MGEHLKVDIKWNQMLMVMVVANEDFDIYFTAKPERKMESVFEPFSSIVTFPKEADSGGFSG